jgi:hypothetical protein
LVDKEEEFYNEDALAMLARARSSSEAMDVEFYSTENEKKSCVVVLRKMESNDERENVQIFHSKFN